ncbi:MAG: hypothetical protein K0R09_2047 [Clostridiales bacterium]|jgi:uridine kinase|nr:hypothetical protein [Clostridiales bacterium]
MSNIKVTLFDGRVEEYESGTRLLDIAKKHQSEYSVDILISKVNNELVELNEKIYKDCSVDLLTLECYEARRIFVRGLTFVLIRAVVEMFPHASVTIEHSLSKGIYGEIHKTPTLNKEDIAIIEKRMREIIAEDTPFNKETMSLSRAEEVFNQYGMKDKLRLFKYWKEDRVDVCKCEGIYGYFYGKMVPSTGYLKQFELMYYEPGFLLRHPDTYSPNVIPEFKEQRGLFQVFREAEEWAKILDVGDVGALNDKISTGEMGGIIRISEALHEKKMAHIADMIAEKRDKVKLVLIAGPSSSGKTTFSKRLSIQLRVNGLKPYAISLDDYFINREETPRDETGEYDFESIYALDLNLLNEHLNKLMAGEEVELPTFNFLTGKREFNGKKLMLTEDMILIAEGIHGLNDVLTRDIKQENKFKIYVSALTQLNIDNHNRIPTTDVRILRRIVRDHRTRGKDAETTLLGWTSLRRGEDKNIFPFQEEGDVMFNSTLVYELGALKKYAEPLLQQINNSSRAYSEARRLLGFLNYFLPVEVNEIPNNSIIREFIGGSCFYKD